MLVAAVDDAHCSCLSYAPKTPTPSHSMSVFIATRCTYFGRSLDLGQFERCGACTPLSSRAPCNHTVPDPTLMSGRFRRIMHTPAYKVLLNHHSATTISTLEVGGRPCMVCTCECLSTTG